MKKNTYKIKIFGNVFVTLSLLAIFSSSCTEEVDINLKDSEFKAVIFSELTSDTMAHKVSVSRSTPFYYRGQIDGVSGALVTLNDGSNTITLNESTKEKGNYYTPASYFGKPGKTYTLKVENVDIDNDGKTEVYEAKSFMKPVSDIDTVKVVYYDFWKHYKVLMWAQDPKETEDFYMYKLYKNNVLYTDSLSNYSLSWDLIFNGSYAAGVHIAGFDKDKGEEVVAGDKVTLEIASISEDYFWYLNQFQTELRPKMPMFSGPSANPKSNISNKGLGFFSAHAVSRKSCIYNGEVQVKD